MTLTQKSIQNSLQIQLWCKQLCVRYALIVIMNSLNMYHTATMSILSCDCIKFSNDDHLNQVLTVDLNCIKEPPEHRFQVCVCKTFHPVIGEINQKERRNILEEVSCGFAEQADSQTDVCCSLMYYFFVRNLEAI